MDGFSIISIEYIHILRCSCQCVLVLFLMHCKKFKGFFSIKFNLRNKRSSPVSINLISALSTFRYRISAFQTKVSLHYTYYYRYYNFCCSRAFRRLHVQSIICVLPIVQTIAKCSFSRVTNFLAFRRTVYMTPMMILISHIFLVI